MALTRSSIVFNYMSTEYLHPTTHSVSPVTPNYVRYEKGRQ